MWPAFQICDVSWALLCVNNYSSVLSFFKPEEYAIYCCLVTQLCLTLVIPWTAESQASLSFTVSQSLLKLMSIYLSIHLSLMEYYSALNNIMYIIYIYNIIWGFPGGSDGKESACNVEYLGLEDPLEGGHGDPLLYSCLENPHGQRSLAGYSPWGLKQLDMTEWLST